MNHFSSLYLTHVVGHVPGKVEVNLNILTTWRFEKKHWCFIREDANQLLEAIETVWSSLEFSSLSRSFNLVISIPTSLINQTISAGFDSVRF